MTILFLWVMLSKRIFHLFSGYSTNFYYIKNEGEAMMNKAAMKKNPVSFFRFVGSLLCDTATMPYRLMKFDSKRIYGLWKNKPRYYALKSAGIVASDLWLPAAFLLTTVVTNTVSNLYEHYIAAGIILAGTTYVSTWSVSENRQRNHGFDPCPRFIGLFIDPKSGSVPGHNGPA